VATPDASEEQFGAYMQGVHDDSLIFNLSPMQIGVLLTFVHPMWGYVLCIASWHFDDVSEIFWNNY